MGVDYGDSTSTNSVKLTVTSSSGGGTTGSGGSIYAWGANGSAQLGTGSAGADGLVPSSISLPGGVDATQVTAGAQSALALGTDGNVYSWGNSGPFTLGNVPPDGYGSSEPPALVDLPSGVTATSIAQNTYNAFAVGSDGNLYGWGYGTNYGSSFAGLANGGAASQLPITIALPGGATPEAVAAGYNHVLVIASSGTMYAWGNNTFGQLGNGSTTTSNTPVPVNLPAGVTATAVAAGQNTSMALGSDGQVYTWGYGYDGELGNRSFSAATSPVKAAMPVGVTATAIAAGVNSDYALGSNGALYAWGSNLSGQLGTGTLPGGSIYASAPTAAQMPAGVTVTALAATESSGFAIGSNRALYAWGDNSYGELGNGSTTNSSTPTPVSLPRGAGPVILPGSAQASNTGFVMTQLDGAAAITSASSSSFTAGTGGFFTVTTTGTPIPTVTESGALPSGVTFHANSNGTASLSGTPGTDTGGTYPITFSADNGVDTPDNQSFTFTVDVAPTITSAPSATFAVGTPGTFSVNTTGTPHAHLAESGSLPSGVIFSDNSDGTASLSGTPAAGTGGTYPITISADNGVGQSASQSFTLTVTEFPTVTALSSAGPGPQGSVITVTGTNLTGATGVNFGTSAASGVTVVSPTSLTAVVPPGTGTVDVTVTTPGGTSATSPADQFTYSSAPGFAFGLNNYGQLGNGTKTNASSPVPVTGLPQATQVAGGSNHSVALSSDGHVYAFGLNSTGQLGNGTTTSATTPTEVKGVGGTGFLSGVSAVAAGNNHSVALGTDGHVYTWGYNTYGQLGNGTTTTTATPVEVEGPGGSGFLSDVVAIAAGNSFTVAVTAGGHVYAWGYNGSGQLGNGTTTITTTPTEVEGIGGTGFLSGIVAVAAGNSHTVALGADGHAYAFGVNSSGQLGIGSTTAKSTPVEVEGPGGTGFLSGLVAVAAGFSHSLALTQGGNVYAFGLNANGQLGNGSTTNATTPTEVEGPGGTGFLSGVRSISAGFYFSLAVSQDGHLSTWGQNNDGQLGNGSTTDASTPAVLGGVANVTSAAAGGYQVVLAGQAVPTVTKVSPSAGSSAGGSTVTITGTNLTGATTVDFGTAAASGVTVVSPTSLTAVVPPGTGTVDVTVTNAGGASATSAVDNYTYQDVPTVTALSSAGPGPQGSVITVTGTNLTGATGVNFGTSAASGV
ncbi:MAG TPA: IPT/TIG domain-containing protein, partial [Acidimicrobiales bacterium]|nr:IPT/TIG domain-containing protein [Acidimicrobiales bacterium]